MTGHGPDVAPRVALLRAHTGNACFACGLENPIGLHIDGFAVEDREITATFDARADLAGVIGLLHGGIAATALDEGLVWAGILLEDVLSVTGTLDLRFRRPLPVEGRLRVRARVDDRTGRRLRLSGEIEAEGRAAVSASGVYLVSATIPELLANHESH
jgi:acyl-coenzyme A thioesterase PaaI-like protein